MCINENNLNSSQNFSYCKLIILLIGLMIHKDFLLHALLYTQSEFAFPVFKKMVRNF